MYVNIKNVSVVANLITGNSELFGDEVDCVIRQLYSICKDAEQFGCPISAPINNMWGGDVFVTALPSPANRRYEWSF